jgi:hypothetical protein
LLCKYSNARTCGSFVLKRKECLEMIEKRYVGNERGERKRIRRKGFELNSELNPHKKV